ncbi:MAG: tyrosine-type recombinase/integrase [Acidobacteriota bacterium]
MLWQTHPRQAYATWLSKNQTFAAQSIMQYSAMLGAAADWMAQHRGKTLLNLDSTDLEAFVKGFVGKNGSAPSPATLLRYIKRLDHVLAHLVTEGLRQDNPIARWGTGPLPMVVERSVPPFLSRDDSERFIQWVLAQPCLHWVDTRNRALRLLFLAAGITVAESRRLQADDVIWQGADDAHLKVRQGATRHVRLVPLASWSLPALRQWQDTRKAIIDRHGSRMAGTDSGTRPSGAPLFLSKSKAGGVHADGSDMVGKPMTASELYEVVRPAIAAICADSDIQLGPQTLRNTFILRQLQAGLDDQTIMSWLGLKTRFTIDVMRPFFLPVIDNYDSSDKLSKQK